jgi:hypothetical protein
MKTSFQHKAFALFISALASAAIAPAQAAVVTFDYQAATDGSGKTSTRINASNTGLTAGYYIETFDAATARPGAPAGLSTDFSQGGTVIDFVAGQSTGCALNSFGSVGVTTTGGGLGIQKGSTGGIAAAPAGDSTCFGFGPRPGSSGTDATVRIDYSTLINGLIGANLVPVGTKISYLGLYYGSIDNYNNIKFYNGNTLLSSTDEMLDGGVIEGSEILTKLGGSTGNQVSDKSNVYVNIDFAENEQFTSFEFVTTGRAFELDNIVVGLSYRTEIPEPASVALIGLGLLGLSATRRRQKAR